MTNNLLKLILVGVTIVIGGCASNNHLGQKEHQIFSAPNYDKQVADSARVTIMSSLSSVISSRDWADGNVYINGIYQGSFGEHGKTFTRELNPGNYLVEVCQYLLFKGDGSKSNCVSSNINAEKNQHYQFKFNLSGGLGGGLWRLSAPTVANYPNKKEELKPSMPQAKSSNPAIQNVEMEDAKKKCINLGFKIGTESFGNCILRLSK
jgi:hypothetical protein